MDPKFTGKIIYEKRKEKGLNQIQLGEMLNVSNRTVSKWENGDGYPDITLLPEIAKCLDISIDRLLTGEDPVNEKGKEAKSTKVRLLHDFKLCYILSVFLAVFGAILGGITEIYSIWAFPILFYTHWEIMFCAVSLFSAAAGAAMFAIGVFRLHLEYEKAQIMSIVKYKALILFILLAIFPLCFTARIIDFSRFGNYMPVIMVLLLLLLTAAICLIWRKFNNEKDN